MMFINAIVAATILAASTVIAAPPAAIQSRQTHSIDICEDPGWNACQPIPMTPGKCRNIQQNDKMTGFNTRGFTCSFYVNSACKKIGGMFEYKGDLDDLLKDSAIAQYNDQISSFLCN
ncbi:hypothetical protein LZ554_008307 [Drepanopeziza brunnea f. sp. 'monogermtubi']|nr:hypothetical protein LZ554_008307 [Drepanopeziza brunnea f. sp. 'monogermtubi']